MGAAGHHRRPFPGRRGVSPESPAGSFGTIKKISPDEPKARPVRGTVPASGRASPATTINHRALMISHFRNFPEWGHSFPEVEIPLRLLQESTPRPPCCHGHTQCGCRIRSRIRQVLPPAISRRQARTAMTEPYTVLQLVRSAQERLESRGYWSVASSRRSRGLTDK